MSTWQLPAFDELRELGSGGSGRVVLARHQPTGTEVAIKYLADWLADDADLLADFRAEAQLMAGLVDPHLVTLYEYVETSTGAAIVMDVLDGVSLRRMLVEDGPMTSGGRADPAEGVAARAGRAARPGRRAPRLQAGQRDRRRRRRHHADRLRHRRPGRRGRRGERHPALHGAGAVARRAEQRRHRRLRGDGDVRGVPDRPPGVRRRDRAASAAPAPDTSRRRWTTCPRRCGRSPSPGWRRTPPNASATPRRWWPGSTSSRPPPTASSGSSTVGSTWRPVRRCWRCCSRTRRPWGCEQPLRPRRTSETRRPRLRPPAAMMPAS